MYRTTASGPSIRFMDHPLIKKTDFARAISAKLIPIKSLGLRISLSDISIVRSNQSLWSPKSYPLVNIQKTMENHHF
jgi:hypothetical protein